VCVLRATGSGQGREPHHRAVSGALPLSQGRYSSVLPYAIFVTVKAMAPEPR